MSIIIGRTGLFVCSMHSFTGLAAPAGGRMNSIAKYAIFSNSGARSREGKRGGALAPWHIVPAIYTDPEIAS